MGGTSFTVDQLAERADVSRRTIFNHFASIDDVIAHAGSRVLGMVIDGLLAQATDALAQADAESMTDELIAILRGSEVVAPLSYLARVLGGGEPYANCPPALMQHTMTHVTETLGATMAQRYPAVDRLDIDLVVTSLISGVAVVHRHWAESTGAVDTPDSREQWSRMIDHLISTVPRP